MKLELFWIFLAVVVGALAWEEQKDKDRCFEAARQHIQWPGCHDV